MIATLLSALLVPSGPIRSTVNLYRSEALPGEPILTRFARENTTDSDLQSATGTSDPEWVWASLINDATGRATALACTRPHTPMIREPGEYDQIYIFGTALYARKTNVSFAGFLVPDAMPPGNYTIQLSWNYPLGAAQKGGERVYDSRDAGTAALRVTVLPASDSELAEVADELASRVKDSKWEGESANGLGLSAADALFSMNPRVALGAWRRLATEPEHNTVNGVAHAYLPGIHMFGTLLKRDDPKAVETLALLGSNTRALEPEVWENRRPWYVQAFRRFLRSESPAVVSAAQKAFTDLSSSP